MPEQTHHDWQGKFDAAIGKLLSIANIANFKAQIKRTTKDLMAELPNADKLFIEQMMYSTYCSALRDDKELSESDKASKIKIYNSEVREAIHEANLKPNNNTRKNRNNFQKSSAQPVIKPASNIAAIKPASHNSEQNINGNNNVQINGNNNSVEMPASQGIQNQLPEGFSVDKDGFILNKDKKKLCQSRSIKGSPVYGDFGSVSDGYEHITECQGINGIITLDGWSFDLN